MIVLLIIGSVGIILYGYLLICRLDRFIERDDSVKELQAPAEKEILLYGEQDTIEEPGHDLDDAATPYDRATKLNLCIFKR